MPSDSEKKEVNERIESFMTDLRQSSELGSLAVATRTVDILRRLIAQTKWASAKELIETIQAEGKRIIYADPSETVIGNMIRRVLKIIRDEYVIATKTSHTSEGGDARDSQETSSVEEGDKLEPDYLQSIPNLKADVIDRIAELLAELDGGVENVATQALEHIHANETIMTFGKSHTVEAFLKNAARKRKFQVIVAEAAPYFKGQELVASLAEADVEATLISDASIFAMMSRVNKVIIGTHTIMANGGLKALCGILNVALAAKHCAVPVFVCASVYKLSPQFVTSVDQEGFQRYNSPHHILSYEEMSELGDVEVLNPMFDYVPPDLIKLFISNIGGNAPTYVYRLLSELYHPADHEL